MDRIEAMTLLSEIKHYLTAGNPVWDVDDISEALDIAIEALEMQDLCAYILESAKPVSTDGDLISRHDAINEIKNVFDDVLCCNVSVRKGLPEAVRRIEMMPSAEPKTGKWIKATGMMPPEFHGHHCCSECGNFANMEPPFGNREDLSKFCPNCGVRMLREDGEA